MMNSLNLGLSLFFKCSPIATCGSKINDVRVLNVAVTEKCLSLRRTSLTLILQLMNTWSTSRAPCFSGSLLCQLNTAGRRPSTGCEWRHTGWRPPRLNPLMSHQIKSNLFATKADEQIRNSRARNVSTGHTGSQNCTNRYPKNTN